MSINKLIELCARDLQKLVRLEAADRNGYCQCVTCGKVAHWKEMQGGHFISRKYYSTMLLEENVHPQCVECNQFNYGAPEAYEKYMVSRYGQKFVDELKLKKYQLKKKVKSEIVERHKKIKSRLAQIEVKNKPDLKGF